MNAAVPLPRDARGTDVAAEPSQGVWTRVFDARRAGSRPASVVVHEIPGIVPASLLEVRPAPEVVPAGIAAVDALTGGLPRGALTEVFGPASSGRTSLLVSALAQMTARGEVCALVDTGDSFAPASAAGAGIDLTRLLWVRCGKSVSGFQFPVSKRDPATRNSKLESGNFVRLEQALKATDLLLQGGGFGMVVVDLGDIPARAARRVPLTSWFRFRRAVENTATVLLVLGRESCAKTCASLVLQVSALHQESGGGCPPANGHQESSSADTQDRKQKFPSHAELLTGFSVRAEVVRSRLERKPVRTAIAEFETRMQWAG